MIYVIGGTGFVGSAYARLFERKGLPFRIIRREDFDSLRDTSCDILINANGNSKKFLADQDPNGEFEASVSSVLRSLTAFKFDKYVHLSTGDVYPAQSCPEQSREDIGIPVERLSRYGLHKFLAEQLVRNYAKKWLVVRMGGFVGPGLKKNAVYDILNDQPVWLSPDSELQFIQTDTAAELVWNMVENGVTGEVVNLGAEGVLNLAEFHRSVESSSIYKPEAKPVRFELNLDKLRSLVSLPIPHTRDEVFNFVSGEFLRSGNLR
jgi:nucleoside-diphosphate-sugar epimerase